MIWVPWGDLGAMGTGLRAGAMGPRKANDTLDDAHGAVGRCQCLAEGGAGRRNSVLALPKLRPGFPKLRPPPSVKLHFMRQMMSCSMA